jgi:hypothetical protein
MRSVGHSFTLSAALLLLLGVLVQPASAQLFGPKNPAPMKKATDLIHRGQPPAKIDKSLESVITPDNAHVIISITKQRAYLMVGEQIYIDTPISSGRKGHESPTGSFHILEKDPDHRSIPPRAELTIRELR